MLRMESKENREHNRKKDKKEKNKETRRIAKEVEGTEGKVTEQKKMGDNAKGCNWKQREGNEMQVQERGGKRKAN